MNVVVLTGRIGQDSELKADNKLLEFSLATNERIKKGEEWVDETQWHNIKFWGKDQTNRQPFFKKGQEVTLTGKIVYESWEKEGEKKYKTTINVRSAELIGGGGEKKDKSDLPL